MTSSIMLTILKVCLSVCEALEKIVVRLLLLNIQQEQISTYAKAIFSGESLTKWDLDFGFKGRIILGSPKIMGCNTHINNEHALNKILGDHNC
jgi:hypothetical protein